MKYEIPLRVTVENPLPGVAMHVQRGKHELLLAFASSNNSKTFEMSVTVDLASGTPNFLGSFAQGPKHARFIYLNSGTYAGQTDSSWSRRAKISLMGITRKQVENVIASPGSCLAIRIVGTGSDGGPVCASVKLSGEGWKVTGK